jgi:glycosyltransferase involved in cell wall biosynthesis
MLLKDEADIIEYVVGHLLTQVDHVIVADNSSTDDTVAILERIGVELHSDQDPAHYQSRKTTELARMALASGYEWVIPCDADEVWHTRDGRPINEHLEAVSSDVNVVTAKVYDHVATGLDDSSFADPLQRLGWRRRAPHHWGKVACRTRPDLVIGDGNHDAYIDGTVTAQPGLVVRHFPYRGTRQYLRKARNGAAALALTDLPDFVGNQWRVTATMSDEEVAEQGRRLHWSPDPRHDRSLIYDPAPIHGNRPPLRRRARVALSDARARMGLIAERWGLR